MTTTSVAGETGTIRPFTIAIPQAAIDDLQHRLSHTRYPVAAPSDSWYYGTPVAYLQKMVAAWQQFDWRAQEARMNAVPNFVTEIDDQTVHFVHVRSKEPGATALLLAHTYPGSFAEFLDMIGPLTDPVTYAAELRRPLTWSFHRCLVSASAPRWSAGVGRYLASLEPTTRSCGGLGTNRMAPTAVMEAR